MYQFSGPVSHGLTADFNRESFHIKKILIDIFRFNNYFQVSEKYSQNQILLFSGVVEWNICFPKGGGAIACVASINNRKVSWLAPKPPLQAFTTLPPPNPLRAYSHWSKCHTETCSWQIKHKKPGYIITKKSRYISIVSPNAGRQGWKEIVAKGSQWAWWGSWWARCWFACIPAHGELGGVLPSFSFSFLSFLPKIIRNDLSSFTGILTICILGLHA